MIQRSGGKKADDEIKFQFAYLRLVCVWLNANFPQGLYVTIVIPNKRQ